MIRVSSSGNLSSENLSAAIAGKFFILGTPCLQQFDSFHSPLAAIGLIVCSKLDCIEFIQDSFHSPLQDKSVMPIKNTEHQYVLNADVF
jgi:hypothetical protein